MVITFNTKSTPIPQSWNDLTLEQLYLVYSILFIDLPFFQNQEIRSYKRILLLQSFCNISKQDFQDWQESHEDETVFLSELNALCACFDFLFEKDKEGNYQIGFGLTRCPYPYIEDTTGQRYYAPASALENITLYEMAQTFTLFEKYVQTKNLDHAIELLATLYRPPKPANENNLLSDYEGDIRLPLMKHETTVKNRKERFKKLPELSLQLLLFWFASCRIQIISGFPNIFKESEGESGGNDYGWSGVLLSLSDGLVHLEAISQQNYANGLIYLSYLEDQRKLAMLRNKK